ncbi:hypothetical protein [Nocardia sp. BMG111209]|uniref:hypothetical protein n=1 Tax=Nocardia sp. BMG111209 TaxID=1160137 RepID=UPI00039A804D|nr:hypothetical protein [Nocardia sp. BMG111209]
MAVAHPVPEPPRIREDTFPPPGALPRYALVTAVLIAIISCIVAAGSAISLGVDHTLRAEHHTATRAAHPDRENIYNAYLTAYFEMLKELSTLQSNLRTALPRETITTRYQSYSDRSVQFYASSALLLMIGSDAMIGPITRISTSFAEFGRRWDDFAQRYLTPDAPGADDPTAWTQDAATLSTVIAAVLKKQDNLIGPFLAQGHADLGS